ncbi:MAG: hypothetical protein PUE98_03750 [Galactobacillus timonensis]|nr:hypothetical protein [Galactobacillus timonensis]MDD5851843.1 hypothetical protein [Galactobacillus timonensis]MDD6599560.1 hypothetical protein [Galactobacillus timonensis]
MISDSDFQKMLDSVKNKKYVNNLLASHELLPLFLKIASKR